MKLLDVDQEHNTDEHTHPDDMSSADSATPASASSELSAQHQQDNSTSAAFQSEPATAATDAPQAAPLSKRKSKKQQKKDAKKAKEQAKKDAARAKAKRARQKEFDKRYVKLTKKNSRRRPEKQKTDEEIRAVINAKLDKKHRRKKRPTGSIILMIFGALLLLYPIISDLYASYQASLAITSYTQSIEAMSAEQRALMLAQGEAYNYRIAGEYDKAQADITGIDYNDILDTTGTGIMGSITIDCIGVNQPIYHGTEEATLMAGPGHMEGTSFPLPTGSTHAAVAGHTGMPGQRMFDELVDLEEGDLVKVTVLDRDTWYAVMSSEVVDPDATPSFAPEPGRDLLTLITCTPYGINDHRLLVHCEKTIPPFDQDQNDFGIVFEDKLSKYINMRTMPVMLAIAFALVLITLKLMKKMSRKGGTKKAKKVNAASAPVSSTPYDVTVQSSTLSADKRRKKGIARWLSRSRDDK